MLRGRALGGREKEWSDPIGLSHVLRPQAWVEFFIRLRGMGEVGAFIVTFHHAWSGIPAVLTVVGWGLLFKGVIRFCAPKQALRMMARVAVERRWEFQVAGVFLIILAAVVGFGAYAR